MRIRLAMLLAIASIALPAAQAQLYVLSGQRGADSNFGNGGGSPAAYVSPYDDLTQVYATPSGAGLADGSSLANAWPLGSAANWITVLTSVAPGEALNIEGGNTYDVSGVGFQYNPSNPGDGPDLPDRIVVRPRPGSGEVEISGLDEWGGRGWDFWTWDGEEDGFLFDGATTKFRFATVSSAGVAYDVHFYNVENVLDQATSGGGNFGGWFVQRAEEFELGNFESRVDNAGAAGNTAPFIDFRTTTLRISSGTLRVAAGGRDGLYDKHGYDEAFSSGDFDDPDIFDNRLERVLVVGGRWNSNSSFVRAFDVIFGAGVQDNSDTGGNNGMRLTRVTIDENSSTSLYRTDTDTGWPGAYDWNLRGGIMSGSLEFAGGDEDPLIIGSAFDTDITYGGVAYDLAGIQGAPLNTGDNAAQGSISFAGTVPSTTPSDYELGSGSTGYQADPFGRSLGARTDRVGRVSALLFKPDVYERYTGANGAAVGNGRSDATFYRAAGGTPTYQSTAHIRSSSANLRAATASWAMGDSGIPTAYSANEHRHAFTATDDVTFEVDIWTTASFGNDFNLVYFKSTEESSTASLSSGFIVRIGAYQPAGSGSNPCYLNVSGEQSDSTTYSYYHGTAGNVSYEPGASQAVDLCDGSRHSLRVYLRGNSNGATDGQLEVYVDDAAVLMRDDMEYFSTAGEQFDQIVVQPNLVTGTAGAAESVQWADLRMWGRDW